MKVNGEKNKIVFLTIQLIVISFLLIYVIYIGILYNTPNIFVLAFILGIVIVSNIYTLQKEIMENK